MRVVVNGVDIGFGFAEVEVSNDKVTRQFTIKNTERMQSIFDGDVVEIYSKKGVLLVKAEVEYVSLESEYEWSYAGRNQAKYIVDCDADKTIQFSESQTVQTVLEEVAGNFGLSIIGKAKMPEEAVETILIGDNLGEAFLKIAKSAGQVITSDAVGNIVIESSADVGDLKFVYGENIRNRSFKIDTTNEYERYIVVCQSNKTKSGKQDVDVKGEYGEGLFVKVIRSQDNLTKKECEDLAKKEYEKDRRKSVEYSVEVDNGLEVDVNTQYMVTDNIAGIEMMLTVKSFVATIDSDTDVLKVTFEQKRLGDE